jgi:hypothetical protein
MVHIIYGKSWGARGGRSPSSTTRTFRMSDEGRMVEKMDKGSLTDSDIAKITKDGDSAMLRRLEEKANGNRRKKEDLEDKLGITDRKVFDGVDNDGNLYKDIPIDL